MSVSRKVATPLGRAARLVQAAPQTAARAWPLFVVLLCTCTAVRLVMAGLLPLSGDEAYYWLWSQHPAAGYYDHPPMVAWVIWLSTALLGKSAMAARVGAVVSLFLVPLILAALTREAGGDDTCAATTGFLCLAAPYLVVESAFITPNSPFLLLWSAALWGYHRILVGGQRAPWAWLLAGAVAGAACLGKLMALLLPPALLLFLLLSRTHRPLLRTPWPYLSLAAAMLVFSPYVLWNAAHQWEDFRYQLLLRHLLPDVKYSGLKHFVMLQAATVSPVLLLACVAAVALGFRHRSASRLYLACVAAVTLGFFSLCSIGRQVELYWTLGGYLAAFVLVSLWLLSPEDGLLRRTGSARRFLVGALILTPGLVITGLVYVGSFSPRVALTMATLGHPADFHGNGVTELYSYLDLASDSRRWAERVPGHPFMVSDSYALSSVLTFYTDTYVHTMPGNLQGQEWRRWEDERALQGQNAVYIDRAPPAERPDVVRQLQASFASVGPATPHPYQRYGIVTAVYWDIPCYGFKGHWAQRR